MSSESVAQCFWSHSSRPSQTWRAVVAMVDTVMGEEGRGGRGGRRSRSGGLYRWGRSRGGRVGRHC